MSEKNPFHGHEQHKNVEHDPNAIREHQERIRQQVEKAAESSKPLNEVDISRLERESDENAYSTEQIKERLNQSVDNPRQNTDYTYSSTQTLNAAYARARKQLKPVDRAMSKVVHNPTVETVSAVGGATVARPSGLLYGALFSFIASVGFFYVSKKYGYEYNAFIGIAAFIGGFFFGLVVELFVRGIRPYKSDRS